MDELNRQSVQAALEQDRQLGATAIARGATLDHTGMSGHYVGCECPHCGPAGIESDRRARQWRLDHRCAKAETTGDCSFSHRWMDNGPEREAWKGPDHS